ncbi:hypothetical protein IT407_03680 [Candidatus Uhrbacteria bacterium]|nr:hypothetical protein [Candidatus Uhrbacteria bacterium]
MDETSRTFTHLYTGQHIKIRFHRNGPFLYLTVLYKEHGTEYGEMGMIPRSSLRKILDLLMRKTSIEVPVTHRAIINGTVQPGAGAETVTVDADDPYLRTWFAEMILRYSECPA